MTENTVSDATRNWTRSLNDASRFFTDSVVAAQAAMHNGQKVTY